MIDAGGDLQATKRDHRLGGDESASGGGGDLARTDDADDPARAAEHEDRRLARIKADLVNRLRSRTVSADWYGDVVRSHSSEECQGLTVETALFVAVRGQHGLRV